ncbi:MAG: flavin reductase family protein [Candidatus Heimdallarchaeota archaeon]
MNIASQKVNESNPGKTTVKGNLLSPLPIVLVGANVKQRPNYLVIGYMSPFDFGRYIFFSIYKKRFTRIGIHENRTFSVNIPSEDLLRKTNLCGSKSGRNYDKSTIFESFYGDLQTAPMIRECPINIECEVAEILDYPENDGVIGRVVKSYANPQILTDGKLDMRKVHPILWAIGGDFNYYRLGDRLTVEKP